MSTSKAKVPHVEAWIQEFLIHNNYNFRTVPDIYSESSWIMLMLRTARNILIEEDDSKLYFIIQILQELLYKITVCSIRKQILECLLSTKLKVALKCLAEFETSSSSSCDASYNIDDMFAFNEDFLFKLHPDEQDALFSHIDELKVWITQNKNRIVCIGNRKDIRDVCLDEFDDLITEIKSNLGETFLEQLAGIYQSLKEDNITPATSIRSVSKRKRKTSSIGRRPKKAAATRPYNEWNGLLFDTGRVTNGCREEPEKQHVGKNLSDDERTILKGSGERNETVDSHFTRRERNVSGKNLNSSRSLRKRNSTSAKRCRATEKMNRSIEREFKTTDLKDRQDTRKSCLSLKRPKKLKCNEPADPMNLKSRFQERNSLTSYGIAVDSVRTSGVAACNNIEKSTPCSRKTDANIKNNDNNKQNCDFQQHGVYIHKEVFSSGTPGESSYFASEENSSCGSRGNAKLFENQTTSRFNFNEVKGLENESDSLSMNKTRRKRRKKGINKFLTRKKRVGTRTFLKNKEERISTAETNISTKTYNDCHSNAQRIKRSRTELEPSRKSSFDVNFFVDNDFTSLSNYTPQTPCSSEPPQVESAKFADRENLGHVQFRSSAEKMQRNSKGKCENVKQIYVAESDADIEYRPTSPDLFSSLSMTLSNSAEPESPSAKTVAAVQHRDDIPKQPEDPASKTETFSSTSFRHVVTDAKKENRSNSAEVQSHKSPNVSSETGQIFSKIFDPKKQDNSSLMSHLDEGIKHLKVAINFIRRSYEKSRRTVCSNSDTEEFYLASDKATTIPDPPKYADSTDLVLKAAVARQKLNVSAPIRNWQLGDRPNSIADDDLIKNSHRSELVKHCSSGSPQNKRKDVQNHSENDSGTENIENMCGVDDNGNVAAKKYTNPSISSQGFTIVERNITYQSTANTLEDDNDAIELAVINSLHASRNGLVCDGKPSPMKTAQPENLHRALSSLPYDVHPNDTSHDKEMDVIEISDDSTEGDDSIITVDSDDEYFSTSDELPCGL